MKKAAQRVLRVDARAILQAGQEPFPKIMEAVADVREGDTLVVVSPFLPSPLIEALISKGFSALPNRRSDGSWETVFKLE